MRIEQEPSFKPITLTIETRKEAEAFWALVDHREDEWDDDVRDLRVDISNWFSETYQ